MTRYSRIGWLLALSLGAALPPQSAHSQAPGQAPGSSVPGDNAPFDKGLALEIIAAWQNSSRGATPQARAELIQKALALAVPANPWPFREPARDVLLAQMWGQLGNEYRRIDGAQRPAALERAVAAYEQALGHLGARRDGDWARVQYGLGMVYLDRVGGERADNLERAIAAFDAVATIVTNASNSGQWGSLQVSYSKAYWHRIRDTRADNLERSLTMAEAALTVFSLEKSRSDWAAAQQALGAAYWGRIRGNRADNIEKAIGVYEQIRAVVTAQSSPIVWAGTQDNLGLAYAERMRGEPRENIQKAAAAFEAASQVFTRESHPTDWAQLNMNFGNLLLDDEMDKPMERAEQAIERFRNALTVYTPQTYPERSARVQLNLGNALSRRVQGDIGENIEQAIAAYQAALRYYTRDNDPLKWSIAQNNLGVALRRRMRGDGAGNLSSAAAAHESALGVQTLSAYPRMHMRSAQLAGDVAAARGNWPAALAYYQRAIAASTALFAGGVNRAEAQAVVKEGPQLFANAAYAAMRQKSPQAALDILESGKARLLRVSLGLDALALAPAQRQRLEQWRGDLRDAEHRVEVTSAGERLEALATLEGLRKQIQTVAAEAGMRGASGMEAAAELLTQHAALVLPVVSEYGSSLMLVTKEGGKPVVTEVALRGLDTASLNRFLMGDVSKGQVSGWLGAYAINTMPAAQQVVRRPEWLKATGDLPLHLSRQFGEALTQALAGKALQKEANILWVPQGALGLLAFATASSGAPSAALIDHYTFAIVPSLAAAAIAQRRTMATSTSQTSRNLLAVVNPMGDLDFT